jgi:D-alanine-D-alanine ligase
MQRKTVLLLFGGESSEHDVSVSSARNVYAAIDDTQFTVILGYIDHHGKWWLLESLESDIDYHGALQLTPVLGMRSFVTLPENHIIKPDVMLPILHGKNGEDGSVQGLAHLLHIPIVGCDMTASVICMNKLATKEILVSHGIKVAPYEVHRKGEEPPQFTQLSMQFGVPLFVKPVRGGSSIGVSKVYSEEEFVRALELAHEHDDIALIERGITGRELEVAVLGDPPSHRVSGVGEVRAGAEFYSYLAKYSSESRAEIIVPADLEEAVSERVRALARRVYAILGCSGLSRVDFFLADDQAIYVNEINTLPGFTNGSMYSKLWRHEGVSYSQLIRELIEQTLNETRNSKLSKDVTPGRL